MKNIISTEDYSLVSIPIGDSVVREISTETLYIQYNDGLNREYVDLGLPSGNLWAKCNIGATTEEEGGWYFQWGDTQGYTTEQVGKDKQFSSNFSDYRFGTNGAFTKYNESDGKTVLELVDDAAYHLLGQGWIIPTSADFVELCKETDMYIVPIEGEEVSVTVTANEHFPIYFEFTAVEKAKAFKFYKKDNHSTYISIPFVGSTGDGSIQLVSEECFLWSSSLNSEGVDGAFYWGCIVSNGFGVVASNGRFHGLPIRGIKKKQVVEPEYVDLGLPSGTLWQKYNLGANSEDEAGLYFQWGDTQGYTAEQVGKDKHFSLDGSDYKFRSSEGEATKYNGTDGKTVLDLEDDAAYVMLGEGWQMPTFYDFYELYRNTDAYVVPTEGDEVPITTHANSDIFIFDTATTATAKAIKFYKKDDHSVYISFPFVGAAGDGSVRSVSVGCYLWSSSLDISFIDDAFAFYCSVIHGEGGVSDNSRIYGLSIRGIKKKYVDLGLPSHTLWAKSNVGAEKETDNGLYFQWGDIQGYSADQTFNWENYKWSIDGSATNFSKYNTTDNKSVLDLEDDAARVIMGGNWQMPTYDDLNELYQNTDMSLVLGDGSEVAADTGNTYDAEPYFNTYWSQSLPSGTTINGVKFYKKDDHTQYMYVPSSNSLNGANFWTSTLYRNGNLDNSHLYSGNYEMTSLALATRNAGLAVRGILKRYPEVEYVDLGLPSGLKWAKCNLGANSESDYGLYFQWGDTVGYTAEQVGTNEGQKPFAWNDYKFGTSNALTKYNEADAKIVLDLEDDAAHAMLGDGWRMPTKDDFVELCQQTDMFIVPTEGEEVPVTVTTDERYPIYFEFDTATTATAKAFKFYKKSDHSSYISIPFVGSAYDGSVHSVGEGCLLWSSSLGSGDVQFAFFWACGAPDGNGYVNDGYRYSGFPVRPVLDA